MLLLAVFCTAVSAADLPGTLSVLANRDLPETLRGVFDIRWADDDSAYLGSARLGVIRVPVVSEQDLRPVVMAAGAGRSGWGYSRLGLSHQYLVAAAPAFFVAWRELPHGPVKTEYFEVISDLDVLGDKMVLVGAREDEDQRYSPDGAIAWIGSLGKDLQDLKPVLFSVAGAGARPMDACGSFEMAKSRFLQDESVLILPGVEPGLFRYSKTGELLQTWQTNELGIDAECGLNDDEMYHLSAHFDARARWINQRRTVDEIVSLKVGPGLVIRRTTSTATYWQLKVLQADKVLVVDLPFVGPSPDWHLRADVRGQRIVFLVFEYAMEAVSASRLVVTNLPAPIEKQ